MKISISMPNGNIIQKETDQDEVIIGRSPHCGFQILDESLSRQHAKIEYKDGDFYITDLKSSNGIYVDGERLKPKTRTLYNTYQSLQIGQLDCQLVDNSNRPKQEPRTRVMDLRVETEHIKIDDKPKNRPIQPTKIPVREVVSEKKKTPPLYLLIIGAVIMGILAIIVARIS